MDRKIKVLIVEDEWLISEVMKTLLERLNYEVTDVAVSEEEAIEKIEENLPDVILMDIVLMGAMDGIETAGQIRSRWDIPIIFQSAYSEEKILERAKMTNPFGYLVKPVKEKELHSTIQMALYKHGLDQELKQNQERMKLALREAMKRRVEVSALLESARAVLKHQKFQGAARTIFDNCKKLIGATAGYVALLSKDGSENEVLFLDAGGRECTVNPELPMPIRGLRGEAFHLKKTVYDNKFNESQWVKFMPEGHVTLDNVLFAPLIIEEQVVGLMGLANKKGGFDKEDARMASAFAEHAALALHNSRVLESLENSESRFRAVAESAVDAIISADSTGRIVTWNNGAMKIFGYSKEEAMGKPLTMLIPEKLREIHQKGFERVVSGGEQRVIGKTVELEGLKKDGSKFPLELSLSTWELGNEKFFTAILHDITERKQKEIELQKSHEELKKAFDTLRKTQALLIRQEKLASLGTLSAGVAHEILNPLNIIGTIVQVMQMKKQPKEMEENLDEIMNQIQRASKITNNLRIFAHKREPEMSSVDIHALFDKTASLLQYDLQLENIMIKKLYDPNLPLIEADEDELAQVFMNLMTNAKGAMKERKENYITLQTRALEGMVEVHFSDTGPGIPQEIIHKIFDPFFTTKDPGQGTGLGLSVLHSIIEKHGGTITVESEEDKGTTFVITLPVRSGSKE